MAGTMKKEKKQKNMLEKLNMIHFEKKKKKEDELNIIKEIKTSVNEAVIDLANQLEEEFKKYSVLEYSKPLIDAIHDNQVDKTELSQLNNKELNQFIIENIILVTKEQLEQISIAMRNIISTTIYSKNDIQQQIIQIGSKLEKFEQKQQSKRNSKETVSLNVNGSGENTKNSPQRFSYLIPS